MDRRSKKYKAAAKQIDKSKTYSLPEALDLACKSSYTKFDPTIELSVRLNVDPKQAEQNIRGSVVLPEGTGKQIKVAVFADETEAKQAKTAGAFLAGTDEITKKLDNEEIDFDVLIAVPDMMRLLSKYARLLGPKGLMPNPKSGTVSKNVAKAVKESLAGRVEYRVDSYGIVHIAVGKASFGMKKLDKNTQALLADIKSKKPSGVKGEYIKSIYISTTMGPSISVK